MKNIINLQINVSHSTVLTGIRFLCRGTGIAQSIHDTRTPTPRQMFKGSKRDRTRYH